MKRTPLELIDVLVLLFDSLTKDIVPSLIEKCLLSCVNRNTAAERRKQAIQESKFLGGDMEHTHLVKGLDFALLQKVNCFFFFTSN